MTKRAKLASAEARRPASDTALPAGDNLTEQFRRALGDPRLGEDPTRILSHALTYAAMAESRLVELNARVAQLEALAVTDHLTGLLNRRGFDDVLRRNLLSAARYDEAGILAFIDLDGFKHVNDRHGHATGDEVLRLVGRYLQHNIRATDYAARLGGDEFAVLFVRAEQAPARERARGIVRGINQLSLPHGRHAIVPKASLGLAFYDGNANADELISRADRAMYADKKRGSRAARLIING